MPLPWRDTEPTRTIVELQEQLAKKLLIDFFATIEERLAATHGQQLGNWLDQYNDLYTWIDSSTSTDFREITILTDIRPADTLISEVGILYHLDNNHLTAQTFEALQGAERQYSAPISCELNEPQN